MENEKLIEEAEEQSKLILALWRGDHQLSDEQMHDASVTIDQLATALAAATKRETGMREALEKIVAEYKPDEWPISDESYSNLFHIAVAALSPAKPTEEVK